MARRLYERRTPLRKKLDGNGRCDCGLNAGRRSIGVDEKRPYMKTKLKGIALQITANAEWLAVDRSGRAGTDQSGDIVLLLSRVNRTIQRQWASLPIHVLSCKFDRRVRVLEVV